MTFPRHTDRRVNPVVSLTAGGAGADVIVTPPFPISVVAPPEVSLIPRTDVDNLPLVISLQSPADAATVELVDSPIEVELQ